MTVAIAAAAFLFACLPNEASSFAASPTRSSPKPRPSRLRSRESDDVFVADDGDDEGAEIASRWHGAERTRRSALTATMAAATAFGSGAIRLPFFNDAANAAVGTLPEFDDANAVLQSLTIDVTDKNQYEETIEFFTSAFDGMKVLRERTKGGGVGAVKDTWLGFGPETFSTPPDFTIPVSSLSEYGGHAALHVRYDPKASAPLYKRSSGEFNEAPATGDNIAFLQLGVTSYRVSQMVKHGGNILDAYGWVNAVSPAGLPVRAIVGVRADPMMFLAVNCADVKKSEEFYAKLGFARQDYPYARLNEGQGQFEPPQPSGSVYLAPSRNSMGILLLKGERRGKRGVTPNPVLRSLNVVYTPPEGEAEAEASTDPQAMDPSSVPISFVPQDYLEREIGASAPPRSP